MFFFLNLLTVLIMLTSCYKDQNISNSHLHLNFQDGDVPSLHPHLLISHSRGHSLGKLLFEGLMRIADDGQPTLAGAQEIHISPDGLKYVFTLRDHDWSDGTKVTAEHYVSAWKYALTPGSGCLRPDLFYLIKNGQKAKKGEISLEEVGIHALDSKTLEVSLENPSVNFQNLLAHPLYAPLKSPEQEPQVFNGPFTIKKWDKGTCLQLERNPRFWNVKDVQLNQIDIFCIDDPMTAFYMFEKQQIDWIGDALSPLSKETADQLIEGNKCLCKPVDRFYWIYLNTTHPVLKSAKIRKALSLSIEREQITNYICMGEPLSTPVHEAMISYQTNEASSEAKKLFEEGIEELNLKKEPGLAITLSYPNSPRQKPLAEYLKNRWEQVFGCTFVLQGSEWNVFRHHLECGAFEIGGCHASSLYGDPLELLERFEELVCQNFPQWENEEFKRKISLVRKQIDEKERMDLLVEAEKILVEEAPLIPVYRCIQVFAHHPLLRNYVIDVGGCVDFAYAYFER